MQCHMLTSSNTSTSTTDVSKYTVHYIHVAAWARSLSNSVTLCTGAKQPTASQCCTRCNSNAVSQVQHDAVSEIIGDYKQNQVNLVTESAVLH